MNLNGKVVAILGPDGAGKTTISSYLTAELKGRGIKVTEKAANYELLPSFGQIRNFTKKLLGKAPDNKYVRNEDSFKGYLSGMKQKPNGFIKSSILIGWYSIDYIFGRLFNIISRKKDVYIFSRYFYDYYFQISNMNYPHFILDFVDFFIPKPDYVFYLKRESEDIYSCKPELSLLEIERQQHILDRLCEKKDFFTVDASQGIDSTVSEILNVLGE